MDWVVAAAVVEAAAAAAVLAMPKPPNEAMVVFWLVAVWPNANTFWVDA